MAPHALAGREAGTSAGHEALATDRAALDSKIGAIEAAARRQESRVLAARRESRVLLDVGGSLLFF